MRANDSLNNYWQILSMHIFDQCNRELNNNIKKTVINVTKFLLIHFFHENVFCWLICHLQYKKIFVNEYKFRKFFKKQNMNNVDNFYYVFFYHWMHDNVVFCDKQQRFYVFTNIFMILYFDYRSIFIFDTKSQFENNNHVRNLFNIFSSTINRKLMMKIQKFKILKIKQIAKIIQWYLWIWTKNLLFLLTKIHFEISITIMILTIKSIKIRIKQNLCFENTSFSLLLLIVYSKNLTFFLSK